MVVSTKRDTAGRGVLHLRGDTINVTGAGGSTSVVDFFVKFRIETNTYYVVGYYINGHFVKSLGGEQFLDEYL